MKVYRLVKYNIGEGIIKNWYKYIIVIMHALVSCFAIDRKWDFLGEMFGRHTDFLDYGLELFWGREPYVFSRGVAIAFEPPYMWIFFFLTICLCLGSFTEQAINGYGCMLILKGGKRKYWWSSICIWIVLVNVVIFGLFWLTCISYSWISMGKINLLNDFSILEIKYGYYVAGWSMSQRIVVAMFMPFLAGVTCSLLCVVLSLLVGSVASMVAAVALLVLGTYYATGVNPYEYAMINRYFKYSEFADVHPLQPLNGAVYLCTICLILVLLGYMIVRKKNLINKK